MIINIDPETMLSEDKSHYGLKIIDYSDFNVRHQYNVDAVIASTINQLSPFVSCNLTFQMFRCKYWHYARMFVISVPTPIFETLKALAPFVAVAQSCT